VEDWEGASPVQIAALQLMINAHHIVMMHQANYVRASKFMLEDGNIASQIPSTQWIKEVEGFDSFMWASLQTLVADYAIGPSVRTAELQEYIIKPKTLGEKYLCGAQKMRKPGGFV
jgi:hypothetical protein